MSEPSLRELLEKYRHSMTVEEYERAKAEMDRLDAIRREVAALNCVDGHEFEPFKVTCKCGKETRIPMWSDQ